MDRHTVNNLSRQHCRIQNSHSPTYYFLQVSLIYYRNFVIYQDVQVTIA